VSSRQQDSRPSSMPGADPGAARSHVVNRTHRVIRDQALAMQAQKKRSRSLWVPLMISSGLLAAICYAVWSVMAGYDLTPTGVPDASDQVFLLLLWPLPVTVVVLGMIWIRRSRGRHNSGEQAL
jgi:RsiW-degrading membrane proteinase PrsW (M82 family)